MPRGQPLRAWRSSSPAVSSWISSGSRRSSETSSESASGSRRRAGRSRSRSTSASGRRGRSRSWLPRGGGGPPGAAGRRSGVSRAASPSRSSSRRRISRSRWSAGGSRARGARGAADGGAPRAARPGRGPAPGARARRGCRPVRPAEASRAVPRGDRARWEVPSLPALAFVLERLLARLEARLALREAGAAALHRRSGSPTAACTRTVWASPRRSAKDGRSAACFGLSWRRSGSRPRSSPSPWRPSPCPSPRSSRISSRRHARARGSSARSWAGSPRSWGPAQVGAPIAPGRITPTRSPWGRSRASQGGPNPPGVSPTPLRRGSPARYWSAVGSCLAAGPGGVSSGPTGARRRRGPPGRGCRPGGPRQMAGEWWTETAWRREEWDIALPDGTACRLVRESATEAWMMTPSTTEYGGPVMSVRDVARADRATDPRREGTAGDAGRRSGDALRRPDEALNRAVKRNRPRFPEDFMFQLTREETEDLRRRNGTSSSPAPRAVAAEWGGRRYRPRVHRAGCRHALERAPGAAARFS